MNWLSAFFLTLILLFSSGCGSVKTTPADLPLDNPSVAISSMNFKVGAIR